MRLPGGESCLRAPQRLTAFFHRHRGLPGPGHWEIHSACILTASGALKIRFCSHGRHVPHLRHEEADLDFCSIDCFASAVFHGKANRVWAHLSLSWLEDRKSTRLNSS